MQRLAPVSFRQIRYWVCLFCAFSVLGVSLAEAQHKSNRLRPRYLSNEAPDQERGREIISHFQKLGLAGDYFFGFDLEVLPRRGKRTVVPGNMWGTRLDLGPTFRAEIASPSGDSVERFLAVNGPEPLTWRKIAAEQGVTEVDQNQLLDSIAGTGISLFELQMPFIYWPEFVYEGTTEIRGRAVHAFLMHPPDDFAAAHPQIAGVRLHLDAKFHALMQAVFLDENEEPERKMTVLDLKKLGDQWIVKSIEVRDEKTRDKVRFEVTRAALDLNFSAALFTPEFLTQEISPPESVQRLGW